VHDLRFHATPSSTLGVWAVGFGGLILVTAVTYPVGVLPQIAADLDTSAGSAGLMLTVSGLTLAVVAWVTGVYTERRSPPAACRRDGRRGGRQPSLGRRAEQPGATPGAARRRRRCRCVLGHRCRRRPATRACGEGSARDRGHIRRLRRRFGPRCAVDDRDRNGCRLAKWRDRPGRAVRDRYSCVGRSSAAAQANGSGAAGRWVTLRPHGSPYRWRAGCGAPGSRRPLRGLHVRAPTRAGQPAHSGPADCGLDGGRRRRPRGHSGPTRDPVITFSLWVRATAPSVSLSRCGSTPEPRPIMAARLRSTSLCSTQRSRPGRPWAASPST